jgi:PKD repeat protein
VIYWKQYSGPGTVTIGNAAQTNTTATFSAPGIYTLELSADDGVHAVAYDAVVITVTNVIKVSIARTGTNMNLSWTGGVAPYVVQRTGALPGGPWSDILTTSGQSTNIPLTNTTGFFRVKGQ